MRLAGETNRAALVRRLIYWKFYLSHLPASDATAKLPLRGNVPIASVVSAPVPVKKAADGISVDVLAKRGCHGVVFDMPLQGAQKLLAERCNSRLFDPADSYGIYEGHLISLRRGTLCAI